MENDPGVARAADTESSREEKNANASGSAAVVYDTWPFKRREDWCELPLHSL